jgi:hypothetical protein
MSNTDLPSPSHPPTKAEAAAAQAAWQERQAQSANQLTYLPSAPTAWKSIPGAVRFVIWIYTILALIGFGFGVISLFAMLVGGGLVLFQ